MTLSGAASVNTAPCPAIARQGRSWSEHAQSACIENHLWPFQKLNSTVPSGLNLR